MRRVRERCARLLGRSGASALIASLRRPLSRGVTILAYHRVVDVHDAGKYPFDIELVSASVDGFASQMRFIRDHYHVATFQEILGCVDRGQAVPRSTAVVTFDDGFVDNYVNAFPILRDLRMPATVFLSTGYLDSGRTYWFEALCHAVMTTRAARLDVDGIPGFDIGTSEEQRRAACSGLLKVLKQIPDAERRRVLGVVFRQLTSESDDTMADARSAPMSWDQVREMSRNGIEFGSHSVSHSVLSRLEPETLREELEQSKARIEDETGKPVSVLAYPVGGKDAFNDRVRAAVVAAGYRLGLSYLTGVQSPRTWDPFAIQRLHIEREIDLAYFKSLVALPEIFAY